TGHQAGAHRLARYRSEFPIFRDRIYLNTCSLGALGERARNKVVEFVDLWQARGASAWYDVWWAALSALRGGYARLLGPGRGARQRRPVLDRRVSVGGTSAVRRAGGGRRLPHRGRAQVAAGWPRDRVPVRASRAGPDPRAGDRRLVRPQEPVRLRAAVARVA